MTMGEKILNMRKARGWSQEELADRVGVTRQAVSRWESGSAKPDADKIIAVCDLFGVSADYLLRDRYDGEQVSNEAKGPEATALTSSIRGMSLKQWAAVGAIVLGMVMIFAIKFLYALMHGNTYTMVTDTVIYHGFDAFVRMAELRFLWYLGIFLVIGGILGLLLPPFWRKEKEKVGWLFESD